MMNMISKPPWMRQLGGSIQALKLAQVEHDKSGYSLSRLVVEKIESMRLRASWELSFRDFMVEREAERLALAVCGHSVWPGERATLPDTARSTYLDKLTAWQLGADPIAESIDPVVLRQTLDPNYAKYGRLMLVDHDAWRLHLTEVRERRDEEAKSTAQWLGIDGNEPAPLPRVAQIAGDVAQKRSSCELLTRGGATPAVTILVPCGVSMCLYLRWDDAHVYKKWGDLALSIGIINRESFTTPITAEQSLFETAIESYLPGGMHYTKDCKSHSNRVALAFAAHLDLLIALAAR